jgi:hypothetical protein
VTRDAGKQYRIILETAVDTDNCGQEPDKIGFFEGLKFTHWVKVLRKNNSIFIRRYHKLIRFFSVQMLFLGL